MFPVNSQVSPTKIYECSMFYYIVHVYGANNTCEIVSFFLCFKEIMLMLVQANELSSRDWNSLFIHRAAIPHSAAKFSHTVLQKCPVFMMDFYYSHIGSSPYDSFLGLFSSLDKIRIISPNPECNLLNAENKQQSYWNHYSELVTREWYIALVHFPDLGAFLAGLSPNPVLCAR